MARDVESAMEDPENIYVAIFMGEVSNPIVTVKEDSDVPVLSGPHRVGPPARHSGQRSERRPLLVQRLNGRLEPGIEEAVDLGELRRQIGEQRQRRK
jgi:hypothetical protein